MQTRQSFVSSVDDNKSSGRKLSRMWMHISFDFSKDESEKQHWKLKKNFEATPIRNRKQMEVDLLEL
ncbi:hypothetical protein V6N13_010075 [Hibiscus sabdariffa]|uniref:Uncharacterized protein n=1 Tax=Hibiscus sabdariffa TaxID=183260 RepID=A0ABR2PQT8_9ROSI